MSFSEMIVSLRKEKNLSQKDVADALKVSSRTVQNWESGTRLPRDEKTLSALGELFDCNIKRIIDDDENFIIQTAASYGSKGAAQAKNIIEQTAAMFAGGTLSDEDKSAFMDVIQSLYLDSKKRAKKFTPKKYRNRE